MLDIPVGYLTTLVGILGLIAIGAVVFLGNRIIGRKTPTEEDVMLRDAFLRFLDKYPQYAQDAPRYLADAFSDHLQRRNDFWTLFGQVVLAMFIIVVLGILLLTRTISAEAGLPILSGISGFAIAKGVGAYRSSGGYPFRPNG